MFGVTLCSYKCAAYKYWYLKFVSLSSSSSIFCQFTPFEVDRMIGRSARNDTALFVIFFFSTLNFRCCRCTFTYMEHFKNTTALVAISLEFMVNKFVGNLLRRWPNNFVGDSIVFSVRPFNVTGHKFEFFTYRFAACFFSVVRIDYF